MHMILYLFFGDNTIFVVLIHNKFFPNNKNLLVKFQMERKREEI